MRENRKKKYQEDEQSANNNTAEETNEGEAREDAAGETGEEPEEPAEVEILDEDGEVVAEQPSEELAEMAVYAGQVGEGVTYRILPQVTQMGAHWVAWFFVDGAQGPVAQTEQVSKAQADVLGVSETERQDINRLLSRANEELKVPEVLRGQPAETKPVSALRDALSE